jgi:hypothetical protein
VADIQTLSFEGSSSNQDLVGCRADSTDGIDLSLYEDLGQMLTSLVLRNPSPVGMYIEGELQSSSPVMELAAKVILHRRTVYSFDDRSSTCVYTIADFQNAEVETSPLYACEYHKLYRSPRFMDNPNRSPSGTTYNTSPITRATAHRLHQWNSPGPTCPFNSFLVN